MAASPRLISSPQLVAEVSPLGAELQRLTTAEGLDLQWSGDPAVWSGRAPILFPVIGALRDGSYRLDGRTYRLPKHGFARRSVFMVVEQAPSRVRFRLDPDDMTRDAYPFEFRLEVEMSLEAAALTVAAVVANRGDRPMPASLGFHPALRRPLPFGRARDDHRLVFDRDEPAPVRRIDAQGLLEPAPQPTPVQGRDLAPSDALFEADALIFDRVASRRVVYGAPGAPRIAVDFPNSPVLGVWTKPGADFLCIEPWSGLPDPQGFDGDLFQKPGVFVVEPGGSRRTVMTLTLLDD